MIIDEILTYNREFVANKGYQPYASSKFPAKRLAIVACMDTRLLELLPAALGIRTGDAKVIKNAGGLVYEPFGESMRSLLVAVYELGVNEIMIIAHTGCGVEGMEGEEMMHLMIERGIPRERLELMERCGIDLKKWLTGFTDTEDAVRRSVELVRTHPLLPPGIHVGGYVMDTTTGQLTPVG